MSGVKNIFNNYNNNNVFVETGSYLGRGIEHALESGFKKIISIEITPRYYEHCKAKFKHNETVEIILGDSSKILWDIIKDINQNICFWLDAHFSDNTTLFGDKMCPVIDELNIIKQHKIKTHTLLIDDRRMWNNNSALYQKYQVLESDILEKIKEINENYLISYDDGYVPEDVIVAQMEHWNWDYINTNG